MNNAIRVGLMVPINNTTMEPELLAWLPRGSTCMTVKIPRGEGLLTEETYPAYAARAISLAKSFSEAQIDVVAFGCTAASFLSGPAGDAAMQKAVAEASRRPTVTTARSMLAALKAQQARKIAVLTPYGDDVNHGLIAFLASEQIRVCRLNSFQVANVEQLALITSRQVLERAQTLVDTDCDALFIACSQLPTYDVIEPLRQAFHKPVMSSIQVTAQEVMKAAGNLAPAGTRRP
jgi:maleate cis-trans isomerase